MSHRMAVVGVCVIVASGLGLSSWSRQDQLRETDQPALRDLNQEVSALLTMHYLKLTPTQLQALRPIAKMTAAKPRAQGETKASEDFRKVLGELHEALVDGTDDERIDDLFEQLEELHNAEKPELDDDVEITEKAREQAPKVLRLLTAKQTAAFIAAYAEEVTDPRERLLAALDKVRAMPKAELKDFREELADEVGRLVAGLDSDKAAKVRGQVVEWLGLIRSPNDEEFKNRREGLKKKALAIVGDLGPTDVLRHFLEHALAELLSNPRLGAALDARE
jgi:hypothetical protein